MSRQRACDAILAVTVLAALLLLPPILPFFDRPTTLFGMPLIVVYVFGVWLAVIAIGWVLSWQLQPDIVAGRQGESAGDREATAEGPHGPLG
jgi:hypothetical protein